VNNLLKLGIILAAFLILSTMLAPLLIFAHELISKPDLISFKVSYEQLNETSIKLVFNITYKGIIKLDDVKLEVLNKTLYLGNMQSNTTISKHITLNMNSIPKHLEILMSLRIAGIYSLKLRIRGV